jgi:Flp pilus assembly protein TadD
LLAKGLARILIRFGRPDLARKLVLGSIKSSSFTDELRQLSEIDLLVASSDLDAAIDTCRGALEKSPNDVTMLIELGYLYERAGQRELAQESYKRALKVDAVLPNSLRQHIEVRIATM